MVGATAEGVCVSNSKVVLAAERICEDASSGASAGVFSKVGPCAPIPFGNDDIEPANDEREELVAGAELDADGGERNRGSGAGTDAESDACGDGLTADAKLGTAVAVLDSLMFSDVSGGGVALPAAGAKLVL